MNTDFSTLCDQAERSSAAALENLSQIGAALSDVQAEIGNLPFFVRGFVSSEVKKTGQDLSGWSQTVAALSGTIGEAQAATGRARAAGAVSEADRSILAQAATRAEAEQPRLTALIAFMRQAPVRIQGVPAAMLPAERRDELVGAIERQTQALKGILAALPELTSSLNGLAAHAT